MAQPPVPDRKPGALPTVLQGGPDATSLPGRNPPARQQGVPGAGRAAATSRQGTPTRQQGTGATPRTDTSEPVFPRQLTDRFTQLEWCGKGTEAAVWRCRRVGAGDESVAVKVCWAGQRIDQDLLRHLDNPRFHQHVPRIDDFGTFVTEHGEIGWVAMEYFEQDLQRWITEQHGSGSLGEPVARQVVLGLADALSFWQDTVDRNPLDFKPDNLMIRPGRRPQYVVVDFGGVAAFTASQQFGGGAMAATAYTPPEELWQEKRSPWPWWSLGEIAYLLATGHARFQRPDGTMPRDQVIKQDRVIGEDIDLREVRDERWKLLIRGLLTRDPRDRWTSRQVEEWGRDLSPKVIRRGNDTRRAEPAHRPITFGDGRTFTNPDELAAVMLRDWRTASDWLAQDGRQALDTWLTEEHLDKRFDMAHLRGAARDPQIMDRAIMAFGAAFAPGVTPCWHGLPVSVDGLLSLLGAGELHQVHELAASQVLGLAAGYRCGHPTCTGPRCAILDRAAASWQRLTDDAAQRVAAIGASAVPRWGTVSDHERDRLSGNSLWVLLAPERAAAGLRPTRRPTPGAPDWWRTAGAEARAANPHTDAGLLALVVGDLLAERAGSIRADTRTVTTTRRRSLRTRVVRRAFAVVLLFVATAASSWLAGLLSLANVAFDKGGALAAAHAAATLQALAVPLLFLAVESVLFGLRRPAGWLIGCCLVAAALGFEVGRLPSFTALVLPGFVTGLLAYFAGLAKAWLVGSMVGFGVVGVASLVGAVSLLERDAGRPRPGRRPTSPAWLRRTAVFVLSMVVLVGGLWAVGVLRYTLFGTTRVLPTRVALIMADYQSGLFLVLLAIAAICAVAWPRTQWLFALGSVAVALTACGAVPAHVLTPLWHPVAWPFFSGVADTWGDAGCWAAIVLYLPLTVLCVRTANRLGQP